MENDSDVPSALNRLFEQNRYHAAEFERWVDLGRIGISRLLNYFQITPPAPDVAYVAYEIVAECRHRFTKPSDIQQVESALHEIRLHLRPCQRV